MSGAGVPPPSPAPSRLARFFRGLEDRPRFVLPLLLLTACTLAYVEVAVRKAFPYVVPAMLDRTLLPETELRGNLHQAFRTASLLLPVPAMLVTAVLAWILLQPARARLPFPRVFLITAWASVPVSLGLLVKTAIAIATGQPDPPVNLGAIAGAEAPLARAAVALTNPFVWLAAGASYAGLRAYGAARAAAGAAGVVPWAAWMAGLALLFGGGTRFAPDAPVPTDEWPEIAGGGITLRYPPGEEGTARELFDLAGGFSARMQERLSLKLKPLRVHVYPDHSSLERATGEMLHVLVTGSIRGSDLLYLELPGRSAALTREAALREALRWVGLVRLAPAAPAAPRWFVEGFVHAAVHPGTPELDRRFRAVLRRDGVPTYARMLDPSIFRTPEGPLLARSLVDHLAFVAGPQAPERIMRDIVRGTPFRDAVFEATRLTTSALESGWTEALRAAAKEPGDEASPAPADSAGRMDDVAPFLRES